MFGWFVIGALGLLLVLAIMVVAAIIVAGKESRDGHHL